MSKLAELADEKCELEMTPMIDVTFLLLVFFLCTIKFKSLEGKLAAYLPRGAGPPTTSDERLETVEVAVLVHEAGTKVFPESHPTKAGQAWDGSTGRYEYRGRRIGYRVGPRALDTAAALRDFLVGTVARFEGQRFVLHPGPGAVYGDVVPALDAMQGAGITTVSFAGADPD